MHYEDYVLRFNKVLSQSPGLLSLRREIFLISQSDNIVVPDTGTKLTVWLKKLFSNARMLNIPSSTSRGAVLAVMAIASASDFCTLLPVLEHIKSSTNMPIVSWVRSDVWRLISDKLLDLGDVLVAPGGYVLRNPVALYRCWQQGLRDVHILKNVFRGMPIGEWINENKALKLYTFQNRCFQLGVNEVLKHVQPTCVLVSSEMSALGGAALREAQKLGVPDYVLQQAFLVPTDWPSIATKLLVWGERSREWYTERGLEPDRLEHVGCPRFDALAYLNDRNLQKALKDEIARRLGLDKESPWVVFLSQTHGAEVPQTTNVATMQQLERLVKQLGHNVQVIIKLHPAEGLEIYQRYLDGNVLEQMRFLQREVDVQRLLAASQVALSIYSTTILEAAAVGTPVVQMNPDGYMEVPNYSAGLAYANVTQGEELLRIVKRLLEDEVFYEEARRQQSKQVGCYLANFGSATSDCVNVLDL